MKKYLFSLCTLLLSALISLSLPALSLAQGQQVSIATTFSAYDASSQAYADALEAWEIQSGNTVEDFSGIPDDAWTQTVRDMLSSGTLDILYTHTDMDASLLSQFVPLHEVLAAYPDLPVRVFPELSAADGQVYAAPVRFSFEALYVNTDLFVENGIELPTTWDKLLTAIDRLNVLGITPIANALGDWPSCLVDSAVLSAGSSAQYLDSSAIPDSYAGGMNLLRELYQRGAFGANTLTWTDMDAESAFLSRQAAMRLDGEWLCESVPEDQWNNTVVLPFPSVNGTQETARIAGVNAGFYITRAAFDDPSRREAAVSLLRSLVSSPAAGSLFLSCGDALLSSALEMFSGVFTLCPSLMDVVDFDAYDAWLTQTGKMISGEIDIIQGIKAAFNQ